MAIEQANNFQKSWPISPGSASPHQVLDLAESFPFPDDVARPADLTVSFTGTLDGIRLNGPPEDVRGEFEALSDKEFNSASITGTLSAPDNPKMNISISFFHRIFNFNLSPGNPELARRLVEPLREAFPRDFGPSQSELDRTASRIGELTRQAEVMVAQASKAEQGATDITTNTEAVRKQLETVNNLASKINEATQEVQEKQTTATNFLAELTNAKQQALADRQSIQETNGEVEGIKASIKQFHEEVTKNQQKLNALQAQSRDIVENNEVKTRAIVSQNEELQTEIKEQLLKATGGRLFGAFDERKRQIIRSKWIWASFACLSIGLQSGAVWWLANQVGESSSAGASSAAFYSDPLFILKATITIPILALIVFCIRQYSNERHVEEIYAFKSALSYSLSPYLELVNEMSKNEDSKEQTAFARTTIGQVFEDPLPKESEGRRLSFRRKDGSVLKELTTLLEKTIDKIK